MPGLIYDSRPLWAVLMSLIAAGLIPLCGRRKNLRESVTIAAAAGKIGLVFSMIPLVLSGRIPSCTPLSLAPGIGLSFRADAAGILFAALASGLWLLTSVYSIGYMRALSEKHQTSYFACFALCLSSTMGIALAGNLLTFFLFFEFLTIAAYPLVLHERNAEAFRASRQYLVYTLLSGQLTLAGIAIIYMLTGTLDFVPGGFVEGTANAPVLILAFILLMAGPLVKAAVMPLHGWLPSAMVAPTPVSALLHAVAVVKAGCFGAIRIMGFVFGPKLLTELGIATPLALLSGLTIVSASVIALTQPNLKQRLAYSTIGQLSYILLGMAFMTPLAVLGAIYHLFAHALMKITLFFSAGAIYTKTHDLTIKNLSGLGRAMPLTFAAYTLCSLGIAGMPFAVGFISKWNILLGAIEAGQWWAIVLLITSALLACAYLLPVSYRAFHGKVEPSMAHVEGEPHLPTLIPLLITAFLSLLFGIFPDFLASFYSLAEMAARNILTGFY